MMYAVDKLMNAKKNFACLMYFSSFFYDFIAH